MLTDRRIFASCGWIRCGLAIGLPPAESPRFCQWGSLLHSEFWPAVPTWAFSNKVYAQTKPDECFNWQDTKGRSSICHCMCVHLVCKGCFEVTVLNSSVQARLRMEWVAHSQPVTSTTALRDQAFPQSLRTVYSMMPHARGVCGGLGRMWLSKAQWAFNDNSTIDAIQKTLKQLSLVLSFKYGRPALLCHIMVSN